MADVTNELMYALLKAIRSDAADTKFALREVKDELRAVKGHVAALVQAT